MRPPENVGLLLRVGIDTGSGGTVGPVFRDGASEYIPIPEAHAGNDTAGTFADLPARRGTPITSYIPARPARTPAHLDPEFGTFTYGDPTAVKRRQLLALKQGDQLVFHAGLRRQGRSDPVRTYIIGHFTVERVFDLAGCSAAELHALHSAIGNNAHLLRGTPDKGLVIVKGQRDASRLLEKALPLSDGTAEQRVLPDLKRLGYAGATKRAIGHWLDAHGAAFARAYIERGPSVLVTDDTEARSYVVRYDTGFAPNPEHGWCSLACCKPGIRQAARIGNWILGFGGAAQGPGKLLFAMRVAEAMSFAEYNADPRFAGRKDNIYVQTRDGGWCQRPNPYHGPEATEHDTSVDRVLIGGMFWYFGKDAPKVPRNLAREIEHRGIGHRRVRSAAAVRRLVAWLARNYAIGTHGQPRDPMASGAGAVKAPPRSERRCDAGQPYRRRTGELSLPVTRAPRGARCGRKQVY
jgi:hypothetical protein